MASRIDIHVAWERDKRPVVAVTATDITMDELIRLRVALEHVSIMMAALKGDVAPEKGTKPVVVK